MFSVRAPELPSTPSSESIFFASLAGKLRFGGHEVGGVEVLTGLSELVEVEIAAAVLALELALLLLRECPGRERSSGQSRTR